ncbi:hypothetical protein [Paenibacillus sp. NPDC058071]|uniref:hypothetical protein n=1 Tax=Paenibacillus sp. NPDC058071 TaxID=3346326 RepID=UPI0036DDC4A3
MNYRKMMTSAALSALLLSSVAGAAYANEEKPEKEAKAAAVTTVAKNGDFNLTTAPAAIKWADPLELAKQYAADTVNDWKETLEAYGKLSGSASGAVAAVSLVAVDSELNLDDAVEGVAIAVRELDPSEIESAVKDGKTTFTAARPVKDDADQVQAQPLKVVEGVKVIKLSDVEEGKFQPVAEVNADAKGEFSVSLQAVQPSGELKAFFDAQDALSKAAESKDAATIKKALGDLLEQYKLQIEKLEAAAK